jgi:hypothetical protein
MAKFGPYQIYRIFETLIHTGPMEEGLAGVHGGQARSKIRCRPLGIKWSTVLGRASSIRRGFIEFEVQR